MKNINIFALLLLLLTFACGGGGGGGSDKSSDSPEQEEEATGSVAFGKYVAFLRPVNTRVNGFINSGKAELSVDTNFSIKLIMDDAPGVVHIQSLHLGKSCPQLSGDTNKDGYIDIIEADAFTGQVIIPLDENLEAQNHGSRNFPTGKSYTFNRHANLKKMIKDLQLPDANPQDRVIKLSTNSELDLEGRVIVIHGTYESPKLPATVQTRDGLTPQQSIPIACGRIKKVAEI